VGIAEGSKIKTKMEPLIHELLLSINNDHLLESAMVYQTYPILDIGYQQLCLPGNMILHGSALSSAFSRAKEVAVLVCTIGYKLEEKVTDYFIKSEPLYGLLLDGIGNAAIESVVQESCELIMGEASLHANFVSNPLSPGDSGFPISEQGQLFELVPAKQIGVNFISSGMMVPRKSISAVIGIGAQMKTWTKTETCTRCNLSKTCSYKILP